MDALGLALLNAGSVKEAVEVLEQKVALARRVLGEDHPGTLNATNTLLVAERWLGRKIELQRVGLVERYRRTLGNEAQRTLDAINNLAVLYAREMRYEEAIPLCREAYVTALRVLGADHPRTRGYRYGLYRTLVDAGNFSEAAAIAEQVLNGLRSKADKPDATANALSGFAYELLATPRTDLRDPALALEYAERADGRGTAPDPGCLHTLAFAYRETGDLDAAIEPARKILDVLPQESPRRTNFESFLAGLLLDASLFAEAETLLLGIYERSQRKETTRQEMVIRTRDGQLIEHPSIQRLVTLYKSWNAAEPREGYAEKAAEWRAKLPESERPVDE